MDEEKYGTFIWTMYTQFSPEEIPENIRKYKERMDSLFSSANPKQLEEKVKSFDEIERNYLNSRCLDDIYKIFEAKTDDIYAEIFIQNINLSTFKIFYNISGYTDAANEFLIRAATFGRLSIVKYLVENEKANIYVDNNAPLKAACNQGHLDAFKYFIAKRGDLASAAQSVHAKNEYFLEEASEHGHLDIVKYLIENGADIHALEDQALMSASYHGKLEVVKYLVENGADVGARNDFAIEIADYNGYDDIVDYLETHGAQLDYESN